MPSLDESAAAAGVALAEASAHLGTTAARLGYQLTTQALDESSAAAVFPLLALEVTAIAEGFAAYALVNLAAKAAEVSAATAFTAANAALRGTS